MVILMLAVSLEEIYSEPLNFGKWEVKEIILNERKDIHCLLIKLERDASK